MDREKLKDQAREFWSSALGEDVAVNDDTDYFERGGHSFMATMIIARLNAAYGARLPLRVLFDNPRFTDFVAATAQEIENSRNADPATDHRSAVTST